MDLLAGYASAIAEHWTIWLVTVVLVLAAVIDGFELKVPNWVTFPFIISGWIYSTAAFGFEGLGWSLLGTVIGLALLLPAYAIGGMGAGDVKLLAALGAWLGPVESLWVAMFAAMTGGVLGLIVALARGYLSTAFSNVWLMLMHWRISGPSRVPGITLNDSKSPRLAYAIPIAIGLVCTLWRH